MTNNDENITRYADSWLDPEKGSATAQKLIEQNLGLWSEILPDLWQGGTHPKDKIGNKPARPMITTEEFDSVYTAYAWANPVDWFVREIRFAFLDNDDTDFDLEELKFVVHNAHKDWTNGKRVLIRCQAGMNRSSVITALVLIREGYTPVEAVNLIRDKRSDIALFNRTFEQWILKQDPKFWQN